MPNHLTGFYPHFLQLKRIRFLNWGLFVKKQIDRSNTKINYLLLMYYLKISDLDLILPFHVVVTTKTEDW